MAQEQERSNFKARELQNKDSEAPERYNHEDLHEDADEALLEPEDVYEFEESFEEFEDFEAFFGNGYKPRPRRTLSGLAARTAMAAANQAAATTTIFTSNGRKSVSPRLPDVVEALFDDEELVNALEEEWLDGMTTTDAVTICSAELREVQELIDKLAIAAASTKNSAEAERLIAAMVPLTIRLYPNVYRALWVALPALIQGSGSVTRLLHRQSGTRPLIRKVPTILFSSVEQLAQRIEHGQPVTQSVAARVLARQIAAILAHRSGRDALPTDRRRRNAKVRSYDHYE
ncbi:MAG: hypothetical protein KDJ52_04640 [Anaerolineae bacterium]|nr:hypothetical protein [Anaerolineae bacterium]